MHTWYGLQVQRVSMRLGAQSSPVKPAQANVAQQREKGTIATLKDNYGFLTCGFNLFMFLLVVSSKALSQEAWKKIPKRQWLGIHVSKKSFKLVPKPIGVSRMI